MLAARASSRSAKRLARSFATVVDTAGLKVAAIDTNQPTSSVTFLVNAGTRYETKPGVALALKNFAFKATSKRTALGTIRESELYGGVLSSSISREHLALTAEFLRGDEQFFVDVLSSVVSDAQYKRHELHEYVNPVTHGEVEEAFADPATRALEVAHSLAFRSGLGAPLFATAHVTEGDVASYAATAFSKNNIAVIGTGIDQAKLSALVEKALSGLPSQGAKTAAAPSSYFGGEARVEGHGTQTVFIGYGVAGPASPELAALSAHLAPEPSIKWSQGVSSIATATPVGASVKSVYLPYSDGTLFGLLVQGESAAAVTEAGKAVVQALKEAKTLTAEDVKKAIVKAKFSAASATEGRQGLVATLGPQVLSGSPSTLEAAFTALDKVTADSFAKTATNVFKAKPTFVAIGDLTALPHADTLGL